MVDGWKRYKLGDLITLLTDYHSNGAYKKLKANVTLLDKVEYAGMIRSTNFEKNDFNDLKYIDEHAYNFLSKSKVFSGDVLMNKIANAGSVYLMPDLKMPVSLGMNLFLLRFNKDLVLPYFLYKYLKANERYVKSFAAGSVTKTITKNAVRNLDIILPPFKEQKAIASILSAIDNKVELNLQMNKTLEKMAMALYKHWFVDFGPFQDGEFVDSELGKIPKGWEVERLGIHFNAMRGLSYKGKFLAEKAEGTPMHNLNSVIEGGYYKHKGLKWYTGDYKERHVVNPEDLIVTNTEQGFEYKLIGSPALIPDCYGEKGIFSHHLYKLVPKKESPLTSFYLYYKLLDRNYRSYITAYSNGTTVNMMPKDGLILPNIVIPDSESIANFSKIAIHYHTLKEKNIEENQTLKKLRDTLLPKLISGEIRVKEAAKRIAEVL